MVCAKLVVVFPENLSRHGYDIIMSSIVHCVSTSHVHQHAHVHVCGYAGELFAAMHEAYVYRWVVVRQKGNLKR